MAHLLGLNLFVYAGAVLAAFAVLSTSNTDIATAARQSALAAGIVQTLALAVIYFLWRFIPGFTRFIFPYLAGHWTGAIRPNREGSQTIEATMEIEQNIASISILLNTDNAESETIVVHPRKLSNGRFELHYIFETRRRAGRPAPFYKYRGSAEIRVEKDAKHLSGSYYTDQGDSGTITLTKAS